MADDTIIDPQYGMVGRRIVAQMTELTREKIVPPALENTRHNQKFLSRGKSLKDLRQCSLGKGNHALVIAAGPSLKRHPVHLQIKTSGYDGAIITSDSGIWYCLRNGIVPDLVLTLDPHATRMVRWFGDPDLTEEKLRADDYFSRQDMDNDFSDQLKANREMIEMVNACGKQMRIALATSAPPSVVNRVLDVGMEIYWWNPMYDDPDTPNSVTRQVYEWNGLPCLNAGGNVGTAAWMMADAVLAKQHVALTGMDFSYYDGTPYLNTQHYYQSVDLVGKENLDEIFIRIFNPFTKTWFYTDPPYMWYREVFLELVKNAECRTYNCTEGGILFGEGIEFSPLAVFLDRFAPKQVGCV